MRYCIRFALGITLLSITVACGEPRTPLQPLPTTSGSILPSPSSSASPSPTPTGPWKTYSDPNFRFTIEYPPDFRVAAGPGDQAVREGWLFRMRVVDETIPEGESPEGQVELGIYGRDADTLESWLDRHSSETYPEDPRIYYNRVSNETVATVDGRPAIAFTWTAVEIGVVHVIVFFSGNQVVELAWFADAPSYAQIIEPIFERIVASYRE